jgi:hypothetical protein
MRMRRILLHRKRVRRINLPILRMRNLGSHKDLNMIPIKRDTLLMNMKNTSK